MDGKLPCHFNIVNRPAKRSGNTSHAIQSPPAENDQYSPVKKMNLNTNNNGFESIKSLSRSPRSPKLGADS